MSERTVHLDGKRMKGKVAAHIHMQSKLGLPDYYGHNLDALEDALSSLQEPLTVVLENRDALIDNLGAYGEQIIEVWRTLEKEKKNISFKVE